MEVVGTIAAIPELIKLSKTTIRLVRDVCCSRKTLAEATTGLDVQIEALTEVLELIVTRKDSTVLSTGQRTKLMPLIQQLVEQLEALNEYLISARSESRLHRIKIAVKRPKIAITEIVQRLQASIDLLNLYLLEYNLTLSEESVAAIRASKKSELRSVLCPNDHDFIRAKVDGTLDWVLPHPTINAWLRAPSPPNTEALSRLLVIHGPKGFGKSVLAAWISDQIRAEGMRCAFFAFFHGSDRQKKCKSMFATLLWQILNFDDISYETLDQVHAMILGSGAISHPILCQATELAMSTLTSRYNFVIDGLDESDSDWNGVDSPFHTLERWLNQFPQLCILLSGRLSSLHEISSKNPTRSIELSDGVTEGDIRNFIAHQIQESPILRILPSNLKDHIQHALEQGSKGMFLWVELVFKELRYCYSPNAIRSCLKDLPRDLEAEYARLFARLIHRLQGESKRPTTQIAVARALLALIMGALEPLSMDDLRYAYAASCCSGSTWREDLITSDSVLDLIGDFVACNESQRVCFCHSSLEDLLLLQHDHWIGTLETIKFFRLQYADCHELMAKACFEYIKNFDFGHPLADNSYHKLISQPFLLYATKHGLSHMICHDDKGSEVSRSQLESIKTYITGTHFGGLLEFVATALVEGDGFLDGDGIIAVLGLDLPEMMSLIEQRISEESERRSSIFGMDHPVTQTWAQFQKALISSLSPNTIQDTSGVLESIPVEGSEHSLSDSFQFIGSGHELPLQLISQPSSSSTGQEQRPSASTLGAMGSVINYQADIILATHPLGKALQLWIDPKAAFAEVAHKFVAGLPIPVPLAYADSSVHDQTLKAALLMSAKDRTEGKKTIFRAWALLQCAMTPERYGSETALSYLKESHEILTKVEDNPFTRLMLYISVYRIIQALDILHREEEISKFVEDLCIRFVRSPETERKHRMRRYVYRTVYGTVK
ncbi:hypothetical protein F5Y16DRAFT_402997 [Xylariaceae sp. FL0255]|nr:hypothetical protein F5Y16DRAFT_402997 [Xylariaceae sp. FL0255]